MLTSSWTEHTVFEAGGVVYIAPEPEEARIWFFTHEGGVSGPLYDSLNISTLVGEDAVIENRSYRIRVKGSLRLLFGSRESGGASLASGVGEKVMTFDLPTLGSDQLDSVSRIATAMEDRPSAGRALAAVALL